MIYLLRVYGKGGSSLLKIGYAENLENRIGQYEILKVKEERYVANY